MNIVSIKNDVMFDGDKPDIKMLLETAFSKEIRIVFAKGQVMKEHKAPLPIIVELVQGAIDFGVSGEVHSLIEGDLITLDGSVPHDLTATADSIVRLTLSKGDSHKRVNKVIE